MSWVDNRENEILGIMSSLYNLQTSGLILTLDRNPVGELDKDDMDGVYLFEGEDLITHVPSKNPLGPQNREISLFFEMWVFHATLSTARINLRNLYNEVRKAAIGKRPLFEMSLTQVYAGPAPGILGIGMMTKLKYINNGN